MGAIEEITSQEKLVHFDVDGVPDIEHGTSKRKQMHVRVWNPTVANLTLMALGSSAPEIILSLIEVISGKFYSGALGPGTIVGSAAFNLMVRGRQQSHIFTYISCVHLFRVLSRVLRSVHALSVPSLDNVHVIGFRSFSLCARGQSHPMKSGRSTSVESSR